MHVYLSLILGAVAFWKGDFKNVPKYHTTILYVSLLVLLYNFICDDYLLWQLHGVFPFDSHSVIDLIHGFIMLPLVTLLYLSHHPEGSIKEQLVYIVKWSIISVSVEFIFYYLGFITFHNGYQFFMEFLFYPYMFIMLRLHHLFPFRTYVLSIFTIILLIIFFKVPFPR